MKQYQLKGDAAAAAGVALIALRAMVGKDAPDVYLSRAGGKVRRLGSAREAGEWLASLPKPVQCRSSMETSGILLEVQPLSDSTFWPYREGVRTFDVDMEASGSPAVVLVRGGGREMRVSRVDFDRYEKDFCLLGRYYVIGDDPSPTERADGIEHVLSFFPSNSRTRVVET